MRKLRISHSSIMAVLGWSITCCQLDFLFSYDWLTLISTDNLHNSSIISTICLNGNSCVSSVQQMKFHHNSKCQPEPGTDHYHECISSIHCHAQAGPRPWHVNASYTDGICTTMARILEIFVVFLQQAVTIICTAWYRKIKTASGS